MGLALGELSQDDPAPKKWGIPKVRLFPLQEDAASVLYEYHCGSRVIILLHGHKHTGRLLTTRFSCTRQNPSPLL